VKHFFKSHHRLIGVRFADLFEERRHLRLPALVHLALRHAIKSRLKVVRFQVADEQSLLAQEERLIVPAGVAQGLEHVRPDLCVAAFIFVQPIGFDLEQKTDTLHRVFLTGNR
jgi:hypothetical protein